MSKIITRTVAKFRNPVTQAIGGTEYIESAQRVGIPQRVYAVAIAPDSQIDMVDLYPAGLGDFADRIRVTVDSPYVGELDPALVQHLIACPVRSVSPLDALEFADATYDIYPRLKLALYTEREPQLVPAALGRTHDEWVGSGGSLVAAVGFDLPLHVMGHDAFGFNFQIDNSSDPFWTGTMRLTTYQYATASNGTIYAISRTRDVNIGAGTPSGHLYSTPDGAVSTNASNSHDDLAEAVNAKLTFTPGGNFTYDYRVIGGAHK